MRLAVLTIDFTCLSDLLKWTADGPGSTRALQLVVAGLGAEVVATPRLRMAAMIVLATQTAHATRKPVEVRLIC